MSEKEKRKNTYLKNVLLRNYKSIYETKVSFENGLNIIIGKNGSGKSNFIKFLNSALSFDYSNLSNLSEAEIELATYSGESIKITSKKNKLDEISELELYKISKNPEVFMIKEKEFEKTLLKMYLQDNNYNYINFLINHGLPQNLDLISKPVSLSVRNINQKKLLDENLPYFIRLFLFKLRIFLLKTNSVRFNESSIRKHILDSFNTIMNSIKPYLLNLTTITDISLNNFNLVIEENTYTCSNMFMEFQVDNKWYTFENLSDGTQRLFYIISEIATLANLSEISSVNEKTDKIILLEEPELGIHPHQLFKLMTFIKEKSKDMQIIITTHSPKCLDILSEKELDNILICSIKENGTKLNHLNKIQKKKALNYIKTTGFLSDYWFHSDLEE